MIFVETMHFQALFLPYKPLFLNKFEKPVAFCYFM